jgi:cytochrome c oxidase subunit 4
MSHDSHEPAVAASGHGHTEGHHPPGGSGKYIAVFLALCVLTGASFFTTSEYWPFKDTPTIGWAFMMAVSCTKAMLVILFFMHLMWEANWKYVLTIPAAMMSCFLVLMLVPDVGWRSRMYSEERLIYAAEAPVGVDHGEPHGDGEDQGSGPAGADHGSAH